MTTIKDNNAAKATKPVSGDTSMRIPKDLMEELNQIAGRLPVPSSGNALGLTFIRAMLELSKQPQNERVIPPILQMMDAVKSVAATKLFNSDAQGAEKAAAEAVKLAAQQAHTGEAGASSASTSRPSTPSPRGRGLKQ